MAKHASDIYLRNPKDDSYHSPPFRVVALALIGATSLLSLRYFAASVIAFDWKLLSLVLLLIAGMLYLSACLLRRGALLQSTRLSQSGLHYWLLGGDPVVVPWKHVRTLTYKAPSLTCEVGQYAIGLDDGKAFTLSLRNLGVEHAAWANRLAGVIPESVEVLPESAPLAVARRMTGGVGKKLAPRRGMIVRYAQRSAILIGIAFGLVFALAISGMLFLDPQPPTWLLLNGILCIAIFIGIFIRDGYLLRGGKYRAVLFYGRRRIARIAPTGTTVLTAPYAGFRAWPPTLLGTAGETLPLRLFGHRLSRAHLERILDCLPKGDPARLDLERYLFVSSEAQPAYYHATLLYCAGLYVSATAVAFSALWLAVPGAMMLIGGSLGLIKRARAIYRIGRG